MNHLPTPILFLIFNRPDQTKKVFDEIRKIRPSKLFIAADGPRTGRPEDIEKCRLAREVVNNIDWLCEVKTLFQEKNLGCKIGATTGINWFFDNVDEGIILEDDCLPDQSFFLFCKEMLNKYRNEEKIVMISGYNIEGTSNIPYSYIFSKYGGLWGWASWRRAWKQYDVSMQVWANLENRIKIKKAIGDRYQWNYKQRLYDETFHGKKDTWDYQWETYRLLHGQLSVLPTKNLIENLGFGADATHTIAITSSLLIPSQTIIFPLIHNPGPLIPNEIYDKKLRPKIPARSKNMNTLKKHAKFISKEFIPPYFYRAIKSLLLGRRKFTPIWNTLSYPPLKGVQIFFDPTGQWQRKMLIGTYDTFIFDTLKSMRISGKIIYDIGAHIGFHSLYFAKLVGENGKVYSFEPNPTNFERFNFILNKNENIKKMTKVFNIAVSDKTETVEFIVNNDIESGRSCGNFIEKSDTFWSDNVYKEKNFIKTKVKTVNIDSLKEELNINDSPDIIKIDVEGAEYLVLLGAKKTLETKKPILFMEIHSILNMFNVTELLHSLHYDIRLLKKESTGICFILAIPIK